MSETYEVTGAPFDLKVRGGRKTVSLIAIKQGAEVIKLDIPRKRIQGLIDTLQHMADIA